MIRGVLFAASVGVAWWAVGALDAALAATTTGVATALITYLARKEAERGPRTGA